MKVDIYTQPYFPIHFKVLGIGFLIAGMAIISIKPWLSPILIMFGALLLTTHHRLRIDIRRKYCQDYIWLFGFKLGKRQWFQNANCFFISSSTYSQAHGSLAIRYQSQGLSYEGYLQVDDYEKIFLFDNNSKNIVKSKLNELSSMLNIPVKQE